MTDFEKEEVISELKSEISEVLSREGNLCNKIVTISKMGVSHLLDELFPLCRSTSEQVYWLMNDMTQFPKCKQCGRTIMSYYNYTKGYGEFCGPQCSAKHPDTWKKNERTCMLKYGTKSSNQAASVKKTKSDNCEKKYGEGITNAGMLQSSIDKGKATSIEHWGVDNPMKNPINVEKGRRTNQRKRGVDWSLQDPTVKALAIERTKESCDGYDNPFKCPRIQKDIKNTHVLKRGVDHPSKDPEIKKVKAEKWASKTPEEKAAILDTVKATNRLNWGKDWTSQVPEIHAKMIKRYFFNGIYFHSGSELLYYFYLKRTGVKFLYHDCPSLTYTYEGKDHMYLPDFYIIDEQRYHEIKGDYLFEDGKMICPYNRSLDGLYEAKHQCMIANNVKIITDLDLKEMGIVARGDLLRKFCNFLEEQQLDKFNQDITDINEDNFEHYKQLAIQCQQSELLF